MPLKTQISLSLFLILLLLVMPAGIQGQNNAKVNPPGSDTLKAVAETDRHALYAGAGYGSNMLYLGSTITRDQPYEYGNLTYGFRDQLYASISAVNLSRFAPLVAFYFGGLSYSHIFNSWFDISAGLYRYQVDRTLTDTLFRSFIYGDATLGVDWKLLYTKISYGNIISEEPQTYLQIKNSRYFQTPDFFNNKVNISFDPYINLLFGTYISSETVTGTMEITTTQQYVTSGSAVDRDTGNLYSGSDYGSSSGNEYGSPSGPSQGSGTDSGSSSSINTIYSTTSTTTVPTEVTTFKDNFGLIEVEFGLPVSINTDFMTIDAEASYIMPVYSDPYFPGPKGFVFTLSCFLKIF